MPDFKSPEVKTIVKEQDAVAHDIAIQLKGTLTGGFPEAVCKNVIEKMKQLILLQEKKRATQRKNYSGNSEPSEKGTVEWCIKLVKRALRTRQVTNESVQNFMFKTVIEYIDERLEENPEALSKAELELARTRIVVGE